MANPNIQIDDVEREMTDEEYAYFLSENPGWVAEQAPAPKATRAK